MGIARRLVQACNVDVLSATYIGFSAQDNDPSNLRIPTSAVPGDLALFCQNSFSADPVLPSGFIELYRISDGSTSTYSLVAYRKVQVGDAGASVNGGDASTCNILLFRIKGYNWGVHSLATQYSKKTNNTNPNSTTISVTGFGPGIYIYNSLTYTGTDTAQSASFSGSTHVLTRENKLERDFRIFNKDTTPSDITVSMTSSAANSRLLQTFAIKIYKI